MLFTAFCCFVVCSAPSHSSRDIPRTGATTHVENVQPRRRRTEQLVDHRIGMGRPEPVICLGMPVEQPGTLQGQRARCPTVAFAGTHRRQPARSPDRRRRTQGGEDLTVKATVRHEERATVKAGLSANVASNASGFLNQDHKGCVIPGAAAGVESDVSFAACNHERRVAALVRMHRGAVASQSNKRVRGPLARARTTDRSWPQHHHALTSQRGAQRIGPDLGKHSCHPTPDCVYRLLSPYGSTSSASLSNTRSAAARFSSKCAGDEVPGISKTVGAWWSNHASAT
jgi:hypothetical protein